MVYHGESAARFTGQSGAVVIPALPSPMASTPNLSMMSPKQLTGVFVLVGGAESRQLRLGTGGPEISQHHPGPGVGRLDHRGDSGAAADQPGKSPSSAA